MEAPILRERRNDEGEFSLLLEEKYNIKDWYRMINVQVEREGDPVPKHYKVYISKNCQVIDLLLGFEEYLHLNNCTMYYIDFYKRQHQISRDKWFEKFKNGYSFLVTDQMKGPGNLFEGEELGKDKLKNK